MFTFFQLHTYDGSVGAGLGIVVWILPPGITGAILGYSSQYAVNGTTGIAHVYSPSPSPPDYRTLCRILSWAPSSSKSPRLYDSILFARKRVSHRIDPPGIVTQPDARSENLCAVPITFHFTRHFLAITVALGIPNHSAGASSLRIPRQKYSIKEL
ncbi:hypothetical protein BDV96DRAFT_284910 [Lophiotrema nucula]|uniref:Uncharacterized protein n=1 Tax=Lophiotrema nucula TaxID=690887 RepID=A0A6A5YMJ8_9PLEO|nr:hypothetical protein BDV96DRAFT_284910 [Lophiotrema nucula]